VPREQFGGAIGHVAFLERGDIVRRRFPLGLGDGLADDLYETRPRITRSRHLNPDDPVNGVSPSAGRLPVSGGRSARIAR
jgi:hypothetical protein